jgi:hypothetical protein
MVASGVLGVIAGYTALALGVVGLILVSILSVLVVVWLRRRLAAIGMYLFLLGVTGGAILLPIVLSSRACPSVESTCYSPSTVPVLVAFAVVQVVGLGFLVLGTVRREPTSPQAPAATPHT